MSYSTHDIALAFGLTFAAGLSTSIGACISFCIPPKYTDALPIILAFTAGVMIYVSFFEISQEGIHAFETHCENKHDHDTATFLSHIWSSVSFFVGIGAGYLIDFLVHLLGYHHDMDISKENVTDQTKSTKSTGYSSVQLETTDDDEYSFSDPQQSPYKSPIELVSKGASDFVINVHDNELVSETPKIAGQSEETGEKEKEKVKKEENIENNVDEREKKQLIKMSLITALAIAIHNFPEGIATFVSTLADPKLGVSIAVAITIHNIPEGIATAMPIYIATGNKWKAFLPAFLSGIFEPIGALVGYLIIDNMFNDVVFGVLFEFVSGIMIYISFKELLPTARRKDVDDKYTTYLLFAGFICIDISLILFKIPN